MILKHYVNILIIVNVCTSLMSDNIKTFSLYKRTLKKFKTAMCGQSREAVFLTRGNLQKTLRKLFTNFQYRKYRKFSI
jgi:hypothetical protein